MALNAIHTDDPTGPTGPSTTGSGSGALDALVAQAQNGSAGTGQGTQPLSGTITSRSGSDPVYISRTVSKAPVKNTAQESSQGAISKAPPATVIRDTSHDNYGTIDTALADFYTWDRAKMNKFRQLGALAGLNNMNANDTQLYQGWQTLVQQSANYATAGRKVSPWDVLANAIPGDPLGLGRGKKGGGGGTGDFSDNAGMDLLNKSPDQIAAQAAVAAQTKTSNPSFSKVNGGLTQKQVNLTQTVDLTDPDTARYVLNVAEKALLGHEATPEQSKAFYDKLIGDEKARPKQAQSVFTPNGDSTGGLPLAASGNPAVSVDSNGNPVDAAGNIVTPNSAPPAQVNGQTGTTETTTIGGDDYTRQGRTQEAEDFAKQQPDYGAYQAATTYMNAFLQAIGGPPGLR